MSSRIRLQRFWLKVHRWIGLALLVVFGAFGITGAVLVFPDFFDRIVHAERYPERAAETIVPPSQLLRAAQAQLPGGDWVGALRYPADTGDPVMAAGQVNGPPVMGLGPPTRAKVWLDPADARVLARSEGSGDFLWSMHATHGHLLLPGSAGRQVVAWSGVVLLISAISGIWLWWPGLRHIGRALKWHRQLTTSMNLHRQTGALIVVVLLIEAVSGIYVAVPAVFSRLFEPATADAQRTEGPPPAPSLQQTRQDIDTVLHHARALHTAGRVESLFLPTASNPEWSVTLATGQSSVVVEVSDETGQARIRPAPEPGPGDALETVMIDLHFGHYGLVWRWIVFASGIALGVLAFTGPLLWLRGRARRRSRALERPAPA